jgi:serine/threonine protein phosphatase 1
VATIAIGDIHGNILALDDLLAQVVPELHGDDTLVFLGDYIDRGPDSRGCVERIVRLADKPGCRVVALLGNHEQWMLSSLRDPSCHSWIIGMEAFETIESYSTGVAHLLQKAIEQTGIRLITEKAPLPYSFFFDLLPTDHVSFFKNLELFHQTADVICVHAGIDLEGCVASSPDVFVWGSEGFPEEYRGQHCVVYGHWNNAVEDENGWPGPCVRTNRTYGIDTIAHGVLTAMRFPDGKVFQSKRYRVS